MKYVATSDHVCGKFYAALAVNGLDGAADSVELAERHARAIKSVLLAAKSAKRALDAYMRSGPHELAAANERRMLAQDRIVRAIVRLEQIEKEVGRGE